MAIAARPRWQLKACPTCQGDMFYDPEEQCYCCLQCGRPKEIPLTAQERRLRGSQKGGLVTYLRYGSEHMKAIGQKGNEAQRPKPVVFHSFQEVKDFYREQVKNGKMAGSP